MKLEFYAALPTNAAAALKVFEAMGVVTCTVGVDADWENLVVIADLPDEAAN